MREEELVYAVSYVKTLQNKQPSEIQHPYREVFDLLGFGTRLDIFIYENDFHNLRVILKAVLLKRSWKKLVRSPSIVPPEAVEKCVKAADFFELPEFLRNAAREAYNIFLANPQEAELYLDNAFKSTISEKAKAEKDEFLLGWAELFLRLINLKALWRCVKMAKSNEFMKEASGMIAENEEEVRRIIMKEYPDANIGGISDFENWCREKELAYVELAKRESFSYRPIMAFLIENKKRVEV